MRRWVRTALAAVALVSSACSSTPEAAAPTTAPAATAPAATAPADARFAPGRRTVAFDVDGTERTAVVVVPDELDGPVPLVVAFHGHGGSGAAFARRQDLHGLWPEAVVVYPDGLTGYAGRTDPAGVRSGWQTVVGEAGDRDIAFYDTLRAELDAALPVDPERVYLVGHSNGSRFVSVLLTQRGEGIAASANLSSQPTAALLADAPVRSMFLAMGEADAVVPFENQFGAIALAEERLRVDPTRATVDGFLRTEPGPGGLELAVYVHPGGHAVPPEVPPLVVSFFQRHRLGA